MRLDWEFQRNDDGSSQGWNDPSIAEFKSNRLESLTRETIQNSIDAAIDSESEVQVHFEERTVPSESVPNIETLRNVIKLCETQSELQNPDMLKEFSVAKKTISRPQISVLSISDYNTRGMQGPCVPGKPFYQYLKSVGQSGGSSNRAGSHGIGKAAPLACSDLRTIFVSTVWNGAHKLEGLVQGRAVLMSFQKKDAIYKSTGYWGDADNYQAIKPDIVPEPYNWMVREKVGTTVHVIGWSDLVKDNWEKLIIGFAICNFFPAFLRGKLSIKVKNHVVDASNILELAQNISIYDAMEKAKVAYKIDDVRFYIRCLAENEEVISDETQVIHLGRTSVKLILSEDAPRKIALIRNNMLITDAIPGFWRKVPGKYRDFAGIVEVINEPGSQFIRLMEPPSHNHLSIDWLPTPQERKKGEVALGMLTEQLKKFVVRHAGSLDEDFGKVDFMAEFFADEAGDDRGNKFTDEIDPNGRFIFSPRRMKLAPPAKITLESELEDELERIADAEVGAGPTDGEQVVSAGDGDDSREGGAGFQGGSGTIEGNDGPNKGDGTEGVGPMGSDILEPNKQRDKPSQPIQLKGVRLVKKGNDTVQVFATPTGTAKAYIRIHELGADFADPFNALKSDIGSIENGAVLISLTQNQRVGFSVTLSRPIVGGLKLVASPASKEQGVK